MVGSPSATRLVGVIVGLPSAIKAVGVTVSANNAAAAVSKRVFFTGCSFELELLRDNLPMGVGVHIFAQFF
jgi:hypothetical protein